MSKSRFPGSSPRVCGWSPVPASCNALSPAPSLRCPLPELQVSTRGWKYRRLVHASPAFGNAELGVGAAHCSQHGAPAPAALQTPRGHIDKSSEQVLSHSQGPWCPRAPREDEERQKPCMECEPACLPHKNWGREERWTALNPLPERSCLVKTAQGRVTATAA